MQRHLRIAGVLPVALIVFSVAAVLPLTAQLPAADGQVQLDLANSLVAKAQYLEALDAFERATRSDDAAITVRARKGRVRAALHVAEFDSARRDADTLLRDVPDDVEAHTLSGDALWAAGLFDESEAAYGAALARSGESSRARFGNARSMASRGRLDEARGEIIAALALAPDNPELHALAGTVYERLNRFADAADEYEAYARLTRAGEAMAIATSRARAMFLRTFNGRVPLAISTADATAVHVVPFKLVRNKVVLQGRINGTSVEWILDTGAERTGISSDTASRAGIRAVTATLTAGVGVPRLRRVQLARADNLEIGRLRIRNVPVSIRDPAAGGAPRWQGESLSPVALGLSAIVDYQRRLVTLARVLPDAPSDVRLPLRVHRVPLVRGLLNSRYPASFVVDTGGEVISISSETAQSLGMPATRRIPLRVFGLSGPDEQAFLLPGVDLDFDEIEYRKVGLAVLNLRAPSVLLGFQVGGIVGHRFLGGYRVAMDLARSELRLTRF